MQMLKTRKKLFASGKRGETKKLRAEKGEENTKIMKTKMIMTNGKMKTEKNNANALQNEMRINDRVFAARQARAERQKSSTKFVPFKIIIYEETTTLSNSTQKALASRFGFVRSSWLSFSLPIFILHPHFLLSFLHLLPDGFRIFRIFICQPVFFLAFKQNGKVSRYLLYLIPEFSHTAAVTIINYSSRKICRKRHLDRTNELNE